MPNVVAVVGGKHSGKTTVIEHLIAQLKMRGLRVGTIKEMVRIPTLDTPQTETDRYSKAGAEVIVAVPRDETVVFIKKRLGVSAVLPFFDGLDYVILEGFESEKDVPRIIAAKTCSEAETFMSNSVIAISGLIAQNKVETKKAVCLKVPVYDVLTEAAQIACLVEEKFS